MKSRKLLLFIGDIIILTLSASIAVFIKGEFAFPQSLINDLFIPFILTIVVCAIVLYALDLYDFRFIRPVSANLWRITLVMIISPILSITLFYFFDFVTIAPQLTLVLFFIAFGILFILWRRMFYNFFSNSFQNKTVVWGNSQSAEHLFQEIAHHPHRGYSPLVYVQDKQDLADTLQHHSFQVLVIDRGLQLSNDLIEAVFEKNITVLSLDETYEEILQKIPLDTIDETLFIESIQKHNRIGRMIYRGIECTIALLVLVFTSPFLILMIIGIKLEDRGAILFKGHTRLGFLGKEFILYKFRSMTEEHKRTDSGADWTTKNDPRVTRVGKIIRKLHIDELAQMINVLRGDISLVGPRPDVTPVGRELKKLVPNYYLRHIVKPGFTGWAQIKYHAPASHAEFIERFQYDLYYIKNREFFFDFGIMVRTLQIIFSHSM